jgi:S-layer protein
MATASNVQSLYIAYFGRPADSSGLTWWTVDAGADASLESIANNFASSTEFKDSIAGKTTESVVSSFYTSLFGRAADVDGLKFWTNQINLGNTTLQQVGLNIGQAAITGAANSDQVAITSKITASTNWTTDSGLTTANILAYQGAAAVIAGVNFLTPVLTTATIPTDAATTAAVAALTATTGAGESYSLTTFTDVVTSTGTNQLATGSGAIQASSAFKLDGSNQIVNASSRAVFGGGAQADNLADSSTADSDTINVTAGANISTAGAGATVTNIENLVYTVAAEGGNTFIGTAALGSLYTGASSLTVSGTVANAVTTTITAGATTGITTVNTTGMTGGNAASAMAINATNAGNTITAGAMNDTITSGNGADTIDAGAGTNVIAAIGVGGGADTVNHGAGTSTINITGTGALTLAATATGAAVTSAAGIASTTNASTSTAAVSFTGLTGRDTFTGGTGADTIVGGAASDTLTSGGGADVFGATNNFAAQGSSVVQSGQTLAGANFAAADTITFATGAVVGNVDIVTDFVSGTDTLDVVTANAFTNAVGTAGTLVGVANTTYVLFGAYAAATGVFTIAATYSAANNDAIVIVGDGAATLRAQTANQLLTNMGAILVAADFV